MSTLKVINDVVKNDTCFAAHKRYCIQCEKQECRYWFDNPETQNCSLVGALNGSMTLEQIGETLNLTRMRVCQIEKKIYDKIIKQLEEHHP